MTEENHFGQVIQQAFRIMPEQGKTPNDGKQGVTKLPAKDSQADRGIGTGDQYKNHHVINLTEDA